MDLFTDQQTLAFARTHFLTLTNNDINRNINSEETSTYK